MPYDNITVPLESLVLKISADLLLIKLIKQNHSTHFLTANSIYDALHWTGTDQIKSSP